MNKEEQIWCRFKNDQKTLKIECVDLLSKSYLMLGQKPESEQIVIMAQFLYIDLIEKHSQLTMDEISFAITDGIRNGEGSCFINVRTWNQFIMQYKKGSRLKRQQNRLTEFQVHKQTQKEISQTINKAKQIKNA
tara:strand:+ start:867 stop:1268 length:402 start_codon:yes stop_codon:yes gene_type:complete